MTTAALRKRRLGRLERPALAGVLVREAINYSSYWRGVTFSSTVEPTIYLLAFGFGFGSLVASVEGLDYVEFVGTGTVATAVLFSSVFSAMFGTFVKREFQRTYDAILAAPVDTEELVTAESLAAGHATRRTGTSVEVQRNNGNAPDGERRPANLEDVFVLLTGEEIA